MYCDVDYLLASKMKNKKVKKANSITLDEAFSEIRGTINNTDEVGKVPNEIKDAIRKAAKHRNIAAQYENIIEEWFERIGVEEDDSFRDTYIDCIQQSHNPEEAIRRFENMIDLRG